MLRNALVILMLAGFTTTALADTVYKWVDSGGQVHYSDLPPTEQGAKLLGVYERDMVLDANGQPLDDTSANEPADTTPPAESTPPADTADAVTRQQVREDVAKARAEQCKQAQQRYQTYIQSQRLYRTLPNGERQYLSDEELTKARIEAKQEVDKLCK